jgi:hypothetical protein
MPETPLILSEDVQRFAIEVGLHHALSSESTEVTKYVNTLAAIDLAARARATALGHDQPHFNDYLLAASIWCLIPLPFKPPEVSAYPNAVADAYVKEDKRAMISRALGEGFLKSPFEELRASSVLDFEGFKEQFLDIGSL